MAIEGKVAVVLNERELVINKGTDAGVRVGTRFAVFDSEPHEISDPDTGRPIGTIYREKIRVRVVETQPMMCIARTYETYRTGGISFPDFTLFGSSASRVRTLRYDDQSAPFKKIDAESSFVAVGDLARQVEEEQPST